MIIAIDIGNSTISTGFFEGRYMRKRMNFSNRDFTGFEIELRKVLKKRKIDDAILSSVAPSVTNRIKNVVRKETGASVREIKPEEFTFLPVEYGNPKELGTDRLIGAYGAKMLYGYPLVLADAGTATTISVVDGKGRFAGGMIDAGIGVRFSGLKSCGEKLKKIKLVKTAGLIGRDTDRCVSSALINGTAIFLEGVADEVGGEFGVKTKNVITGGFSELIFPRLKSFILDREIVLKGLNLACLELRGTAQNRHREPK